MSTTSLEREIKLRFNSVEDARKAVLAAGCTPRLGRRLQADALLDSEDEQLRRRRCVLRVRVENGKSRVTFKGPVQPSTMKLREEFSHDDVIVAIDETPVGIFVEVEGCEQGIENAAAALGRSQADYILDSYRSLFLQHREAYGLDTSDMVFGTEAALLRAAASD